jgi:hypothetical protein
MVADALNLVHVPAVDSLRWNQFIDHKIWQLLIHDFDYSLESPVSDFRKAQIIFELELESNRTRNFQRILPSCSLRSEFFECCLELESNKVYREYLALIESEQRKELNRSIEILLQSTRTNAA